MVRISKNTGIKSNNLVHFEELCNLYCGKIFMEKWMRFACFKLSFRHNFVRLCRRHSRGESEGILEWVLCMARVRKLSLEHTLEKA
jgi:hypothetical protein